MSFNLNQCVTVIGICGGSASGKTTLCSLLKKQFKDDVQVVSQDSYYHDNARLTEEEIKKINFDDPVNVDLEQLHSDIRLLKQGVKVAIPQYCFKTHSRLNAKVDIPKSKIIIVEGLFVFDNENIRNQFDYKVFVSADDDISLIRRVKRDISERGRSIDSVFEQYLKQVKPMYKKHIENKKQYSDQIVNTSAGLSDNDIDLIVSKINACLAL